MGGHGGLNILPQKRWNVYNFDNREKVRKDEEEAAEKERENAEEQRQRDGEARLRLLRSRARQREGTLESQLQGEEQRPLIQDSADGTEAAAAAPATGAAVDGAVAQASQPATSHFNLFADLEEAEKSRDKDGHVAGGDSGSKTDRRRGNDGGGKKERSLKDQKSEKAREEEDQEKYRLGYGVVGKQAPWYAREGRGEEERSRGGLLERDRKEGEAEAWTA